MARSDEVPGSHTDVLIIGAGPAGLTAAYWMAQYGVKARIIDKRGTKIFNGQADGLRARTQELFDSMDIQDRVSKECRAAYEFRVWGPDGNGGIARQSGVPVTKETYAKSRFPVTGLNQGRIERFILDAIKKAAPDLQVERGVIAESLDYNEELEKDPQAYPITIKLRTLSEEEANPSPMYGSSGPRDGLFRSNLAPDDWDDLINKSKAKAGKTEVVKAKYVIGCDGAHSWTRKQLGIQLEGAATDFIWGVMDVVPISNFPDMRHAAVIKNEAGTILLICRERGLMRLYIPLTHADDTSIRVDRSNINLDLLRETAKKIFHPYNFDFKICDWWSAYQVGQRVAPRMHRGNRIFIAGDACHTHSPKVGAGMNISIQDGFNIGWKVASAAAGITQPAAVLPTYELERHPVAERLADFDRNWSVLFTAADTKPEDYKARNDAYEDFAQGFVLDYPESRLVRRAWRSGLAAKLVPGERFWPAKLVAHADGFPVWSTHLMKSDGRWRVVVLAGDVAVPAQMRRVEALCERLSGEKSAIRRFAPAGKKLDAVIDTIAVHCAPRAKVELFDFPEILRPMDEVRGVDYYKIWVDEESELDQDCDGKAFEKWGLDRSKGAVLVMRPDQQIGWMGDLEDVEEMESYFEDILQVPS
ncbi:putative phenol 2- protein [Neofusicoccum parvum UCRNP2]|uniref:Phenol 2-monooxygenase n=2 Tax=Neofusicoccum parvum TaxID=310453 RepID=A0ACB5SMY2_9PEZI|nr:putative phenol 2- protein [Neofusicoccum parvum UCRNP2]GME48969.1 Phenol 2-monooxygenase [Neofusicoccum parvum]